MKKFVLLLALSLVAVVPSMGQEDSLSVGKKTGMMSIYELGLKFPVTTITDDSLLLLRMDYDEDMVLEGGYDASFGVNGGEFVVDNAGFEPVAFHYKDASGRLRGMLHNIRVNDWGYIVSADYYEWYGDDVDSVYVYAKEIGNMFYIRPERDKYRHYYEASLQDCTSAHLTMDYNADGRIAMIVCNMLVTENGRVEKEIIDSINFNWGDDGFLGMGELSARQWTMTRSLPSLWSMPGERLCGMMSITTISLIRGYSKIFMCWMKCRLFQAFSPRASGIRACWARLQK